MIIVTGASGGLGQGLVEELAGLDSIVGTYFSNSSVIASSKVRMEKVDVTDAESVEQFVQSIREEAGRITLVNLAGISGDGLSLHLKKVDWERAIAVSLTGSFLMSRAVARLMIRHRWGRIINVGSAVARLSLPGAAAYASAKAGLEALTRTLAQEYARYDITVNCLRLGYFSRGLIDTLSERGREQAIGRIATRRLGTPADLAVTITYLIDSSYMTGAVLDLDGGLT